MLTPPQNRAIAACDEQQPAVVAGGRLLADLAPPRHRRQTPAVELREREITADGAVRGYASVFGGAPDSYGSVVAPGAFRLSLADHAKAGRPIPMLWSHRTDEPIGRWDEVREDGVGLRVAGTLSLATQRGAEAHQLLLDRALTGLSIGFDVAEDGARRGRDGVTYLEKINLWEASVVCFPANDRARVDHVRSAAAVETIRDFQTWLRQVGGFSKSQAHKLASRGWRALQPDADAAEFLDELHKATNHLKDLRRN